MKVEFYCGNVPSGGEECGQEWVEEFDPQDIHRFSRAGRLLQNEAGFRATCPKCGVDAEAFQADDPDAP